MGMVAAIVAAVLLIGTQMGPSKPFDSLRGPRVQTVALGHSSLGRPIRITAFGNTKAGRRMLVVGCIHGTECAGTAAVRRLTVGCPPMNADIWLLENMNPDGYARGSRLNGRGVDLNRNFPSGWRASGRPGDLQYPGARPLSEVETRIARNVVRRVRPDVTIWFHQQAQPLVRAWDRSIPAARRYARLAGLPFRKLPWLAGTAPNWQNHRFPGTSSFVVELPFGKLSPRAAARHAAAMERLAGEK
jgi:protein MpaA